MFSLKMRALVAVSGGVDSMVLLDLYKEEDIVVGHINHNTRGIENDLEEKMISSFCKKNDIPFQRYDYKHKQGNFHKKAREFRYNTFQKIVDEKNLDFVLVAHHFDDQVENILMNPQKIGSKLMKEEENINGLKVLRPLLNKKKEDIYIYAKKNNVPYMEDSSNKEDKYLRNRIRKILKGKSEEEKEDIYNEELKRVNALKDKEKELSIRDIKAKDLTKEEYIYIYLKKNGIISNISRSKLSNILNFLKKEKNGYIQIDKNNLLEVSYGNVFVKGNKINKTEEKKEVIIGKNKFNGFIFENNIKGFVRAPKKGDVIKLKKGSKKVSRFLIDQKIPREDRNIWPIIVDEENQIIRVLRKTEVKKENNGN